LIQPLPPEADTKHKKRPRRIGWKTRAFGLGGLAVGLMASLFLGHPGGQADAPPDEQPAGLEVPAALPKNFDDAVGACTDFGIGDIKTLDHGASLQMHTPGARAAGAPYAAVVCILTELQAPESLLTRMDSSPDMDTPSARWGNFSASWSYHPDRGMTLTVETVDKK